MKNRRSGDNWWVFPILAILTGLFSPIGILVFIVFFIMCLFK